MGSKVIRSYGSQRATKFPHRRPDNIYYICRFHDIYTCKPFGFGLNLHLQFKPNTPMLQRIQTVFLLLVVLLMLLMLIFPLWSYQAQDMTTNYVLTSFYLEVNDSVAATPQKVFFPYTLVSILAVLAAMVGIIEITKFKNRLLQMKLGALNSLFMAGTMGLSLYFASEIMNEKQLQYGWSYGIGVFFPAAAMICNVIANRFIRKDERLVRSVDRIR